METCFKILQLKFDQKLTNRCIGLTLHISASTLFEVLARFKASSRGQFGYRKLLYVKAIFCTFRPR
ncbi:hypothetical protein DUB99_19930 [Salmonella enterica subsp. enterica serovar Bonariensis]|nr:hypothetical protein [Salmonella enterica]EBW7040348.1 hypothetical protein [Salmonella enterica subsp. enterica serovar Bonariensis]EBD4898043.1 hypothetical protein [Salmonella enterica]EBM3942756.1 hypothetical protein [Salmonella enterica]EBY0067083.1 hypothetical protein [Salmonella enterica subsp. enterica serovar Bonariensis]